MRWLLAPACLAALALPSAALAGPQSVFPPVGPTGAPGLGISTMAINAAQHLIITFTDGSTQDAGAVAPIPAIIATPGAVGSATVPMPQKAATGWACSVNDLTTTSAAVAISKEVATTTTSVTVAVFSDAMAPSTWGSSDVLQLNCRPY